MARTPSPCDDSAPEALLSAVEPARRQAEARRLDALFRTVTGWPPRVWGGRILGYGQYRYTSGSGRSGTWLATGFASGKARHPIHIMPGYAGFGSIRARLGRHRAGKACLYGARLEDIDLAVLAELIGAGLDDLSRQWPVEPG
jgi:hypothetical protein